MKPCRGLSIAVFLVMVTLMVTASACTAGGERAQRLDLARYKVLDLTHTFDANTIYWPTDQGFQHEQKAFGMQPAGFWYSSYTLAGSEHGGTHLDAPVHFAEGKRTADQVPVEQLIGEAAVIDITEQCANDPDYLLAVADIEAHEKQYGLIPADAIVLVKTGWGKFWPGKKAYLGDDRPGDITNLHFPGISPKAAEFLVARRAAVVGIDTASIDAGTSKDFRTHQILLGAEIPGLENVANLESVPARGAIVFALPMKIGAGSGAPCRIVALVPPS